MDEAMHWDANWHSGWFFGMHLALWIFWIVVALAVWGVLTRSPTPAAKGESALEVLRRRYAEGALTTEEYEERRAKLAETGA
jgi:putative membrane protein